VTRGNSNDLASILMAGWIRRDRDSEIQRSAPAPNGTTFTASNATTFKGDTAQLMTELAAAAVEQVTQITVGDKSSRSVWA